MGPIAVYSLGRLLIFGAVVGVGYLVGLRSFPLFIVAIAVSLPLAYVVLRKQRNAMAAELERRVDARRERKQQLRSQLRGDDED